MGWINWKRMIFSVDLPFARNLLRVSFNYDFMNSFSGATVKLSINDNLVWYAYIPDKETDELNHKVGVFEEFISSLNGTQAQFVWEIVSEDSSITEEFAFGVSSFIVQAISQ